MLNLNWKRSNLRRGDRVRVSENMLVTSNGKRFLRAEYMDETDNGIRLRFFFEPGPCTEDKKWDYDVFINWVSIYAGDVKLKTLDGTDIRAERLFR